MAKYRAIPQGFMTVGEVAKKMGGYRPYTAILR